MTIRIRSAILATLVTALAGCAGCDTVPADAVTDCDAQILPAGAATDILFVVDDSGSMREEQEELARNLGDFIEALVNAPVQLDVRIGVTNTSVHDFNGGTAYGAWSGGAPFPGVPGTPYPAGAIVAIEQDPGGVGSPGHFLWGTQYDPANVTSTWGGPRILASDPSLVRDFEANVLHGVWGSSKEQPLAAMRLALEKTGAGGVNFGFQRAGARLAVVVLTDEDDCSSPASPAVANDTDCAGKPGSLTPLADYVTYLGSTAFADAGPPVFALIAGFDPAGVPSACQGSDPVFVPTTATSSARTPDRLNELVGRLESAAAGRTLKRSICGTFGPALLDIASMIIPQTVTLTRAPADPAMLAVSLDRDGATVPCDVAVAGSAEATNADAVYTPPQEGTAATITFQRACHLGIHDRVEIRIVCAR